MRNQIDPLAVLLTKNGKSEDEVARISVLTDADAQFERSQRSVVTEFSPAYRAVWEDVPAEAFALLTPGVPRARWRPVMERCLETVRENMFAGTTYGDDGKLSEKLLAELGAAGFFGLLVGPEHGGSGCTMREFMEFLSRVAQLEPTLAGLLSIHQCIGAVDPLQASVNVALKERLLPLLASGKKLSAFALTEPGAGSDLTAVSTTATLVDGRYLVNGEKLFISNLTTGRVIALVVRLENGKLGVLIAELPEQEDATFTLVSYGIYALRRTYNQGIRFTNFPVPEENLLHLPDERSMPNANIGLMLAYHGLNRGRVALCANAAGVLRPILRDMVNWSGFRKTYGAKIAQRELVRWRLAEVASLIVGADAMRDWGASLLDADYRGELECIIAKIFGADALVTALNRGMLTHGGRTFLHGHPIGDNVYELLAPSVYEGERQMLAMAFLKSLAKKFSDDYPGQVIQAAVDAGIQPEEFNPARFSHFWKTRHACLRLVRKAVQLELRRPDGSHLPVERSLRRHTKFATRRLARLCVKLYRTILIHQAKLIDEQVIMVEELSFVAQKLVTILVTCIHASRSGDEATILAADLLCMNLRLELTGDCGSGLREMGRHYTKRWLVDKFTRAKYTAAYRSTVNRLATMILTGQFSQIAGVPKSEIMRPYDTTE